MFILCIFDSDQLNLILVVALTKSDVIDELSIVRNLKFKNNVYDNAYLK